jgi:translation initiation factor 2 subunit 2
MLDKAYSLRPQERKEHRRFEIPIPLSSLAGPKTLIHNFNEICETLNRDPRYVLKYLSGELATAGSMNGPRAAFQGRFNRETLTQLINRFAEEFVFCPICNLPDTKITKEKRLFFLKCEACGARSSVRAV